MVSLFDTSKIGVGLKANIITTGQDNVAKKVMAKTAVTDLIKPSGGSSGNASGYGDVGLVGDVSTVGGVAGNGTSTEVKSTMSEEEVKEIEAMPDSNTSSEDLINPNDIISKAASNKKNDFWHLREEVFLYTIPDKKIHTYLTSFQIDSDKNDIMTTCQLEFPYHTDLMEYWIPGQMSFMIIGGTFDREVLFIGRVSEVNQVGEDIQVVGQNLGWKFKQQMKTSFEQKIQGQKVKNVVKAIFKELKFDKGKYHINLSGIPDIDDYILDEQCSVKKKGETVENVPDLEQVISNLKKYNIGEYVALKSQTRETQAVGDAYDKQVKMSALDWVVDAKNSYIPSSYRKSYGVTAEIEDGEVVYRPIESKLYPEGQGEDYMTVDYSGDGDNTYEDVLHSIASAIDAHFYFVDNTVCFVSFNALFAMNRTVSIQKAITPRIEFWQLLEDSYELDVNQYGFYNTVEIKYKDGTLERAYDDLVRIYGEVKVTYEEPDLSYDAAMLKAQAYLSAHVRDFAMEIKATVLYSGKIIPSTFIKLKNPLTMSENLFFVYGISVSWDAGGSTIIGDLDLRYGPENPDNPEVPEVGMGYANGGVAGTVSGAVSADVATAAQQICGNLTDPSQKAYAIYQWLVNTSPYEFYTNHRYSMAHMLQGGGGNCMDHSELYYQLCTAAGVKCATCSGNVTFKNGSYSGGHGWNLVEYNGQMVLVDTGRKLTTFGHMNDVTIHSQNITKKNYS